MDLNRSLFVPLSVGYYSYGTMTFSRLCNPANPKLTRDEVGINETPTGRPLDFLVVRKVRGVRNVNPFNASCSKLLLFKGFNAILV